MINTLCYLEEHTIKQVVEILPTNDNYEATQKDQLASGVLENITFIEKYSDTTYEQENVSDETTECEVIPQTKTSAIIPCEIDKVESKDAHFPEDCPAIICEPECISGYLTDQTESRVVDFVEECPAVICEPECISEDLMDKAETQAAPFTDECTTVTREPECISEDLMDKAESQTAPFIDECTTVTREPECISGDLGDQVEKQDAHLTNECPTVTCEPECVPSSTCSKC